MTDDLFLCGACGFTCAAQPWDENLKETQAYHEAGHAAMNWHRLHEVEAVCLHPDGSGRCGIAYGGELGSPLDLLLIHLAGPVGELGPLRRYNPAISRSQDLDQARFRLLSVLYQRGTPTANEAVALQELADQTAALLFQTDLSELWSTIAEALLDHAWLSAERVRALCQAHDRDVQDAEA
jgi:hypothetical protein